MLDAAKITLFLETTKKKQEICKLSANYYKINYKLLTSLSRRSHPAQPWRRPLWSANLRS